jgi:hypothetical protein
MVPKNILSDKEKVAIELGVLSIKKNIGIK